MKVADDDENDSGRLTGDVTGTVSDGVLTLTISRINVAGGNYGCMFNQGTESCPVIASGSVIARITKSGASYSIRPVGNMTKYLTDLGGLLTITKTK